MPSRRGRGRPAHPDVLTPAEWRVLHGLRHGLSQRQVAERHGISVYGVRYHARNIAAKLGVDGIAAVRAWPGQPFDSALAVKGRTSVSDGLQLGPLGQVSLLMTDTARAEAFYGETLGLPHVFTFGDLAFFWAHDVRIYLQRVPESEWRPSSVLYFLVPDIQAAHANLQARGARFTGAPHMIYRDDATGSEEWMAFFEDSEGNMLAIMSRVAGAA